MPILKKALKWAAFIIGGIMIYLLYVWLFPSTNLPYPVVYVGTDEEKVEMKPISVSWHDEVFVEFDSFDVVTGKAGMPEMTVDVGEQLKVTLKERDEQVGVFEYVEMEVEAITDAVFFSEKELYKESYKEFTLDNEVAFSAPEKPGVYALEFELKVGEDRVDYAIRLFVEQVGCVKFK